MSEVLLLNASGLPVSWLPLSATSWQNAVRLIWMDVVEVLHLYDDWRVHSPSTIIEVPSVIMLRKQVQGFRNWTVREEYPQARLVHLRDLFQCQYCGVQFPANKLTLDHVIPRYYGGKTRYDNVTTACAPCNGNRGCDYRIQPMTKPFAPTMGYLLRNMRKFPITVPDAAWIAYLGWDIARVQVIPRQNQPIKDDFHFDTSIGPSLDCKDYDLRL